MVRIHLGVLTYDDSTDAGTEFGPQLRNGRHSLSRSCWPCQATALQSFGLHGVSIHLAGGFSLRLVSPNLGTAKTATLGS